MGTKEFTDGRGYSSNIVTIYNKTKPSQATATIMRIHQSQRDEKYEEDAVSAENEQEEIDFGEEEEIDDDDGEQLVLEPYERNAISSSNIRKFVIPKINFAATSYTELIDWNKANLTEPPLTKMLSDDEIKSFDEIPFEVPKYPCHTQAVERAIRLVSEASTSVVGFEARDGFIRQRIRSRKELNTFDSKKDYFPKIDSA